MAGALNESESNNKIKLVYKKKKITNLNGHEVDRLTYASAGAPSSAGGAPSAAGASAAGASAAGASDIFESTGKYNNNNKKDEFKF